MSKHVCGVHPGDYGAGDRSRTYDLLITNELLYQLSYTGGTRGGESVGKSGQLLK